jgi:hypothetical protein
MPAPQALLLTAELAEDYTEDAEGNEPLCDLRASSASSAVKSGACGAHSHSGKRARQRLSYLGSAFAGMSGFVGGLARYPAGALASAFAPNRSIRWSPTRRALATVVRVGFTAAEVTKKEVSVT